MMKALRFVSRAGASIATLRTRRALITSRVLWHQSPVTTGPTCPQCPLPHMRRHGERLRQRRRGSTLRNNVPNGEPWGENVYTSRPRELNRGARAKTQMGGGAPWRESGNQSTREKEKRQSSRGAHHVHTGSLPRLLSRHVLPSKFLTLSSPWLNHYAHTIPTVSRGVTYAVVCTYGCDGGRISPTRCAVIDAALDGR
jgi:hypothetical protein